MMDVRDRILAEANADGFVNFGDVARGLLNQQAQYASNYITGLSGTPILTEGLRIRGDSHNYHSLLIHKDDMDEFVSRVIEYRGF